jgi:hypothetical protein
MAPPVPEKMNDTFYRGKKWMTLFIVAPERISIAYLINPSHQSVCVCVCVCVGGGVHLMLLGNGLVKIVTAATNTHATVDELLGSGISMASMPYAMKVGSPSQNFLFLGSSYRTDSWFGAATVYGLDDRGIRVLFVAEAVLFSVLCNIETGLISNLVCCGYRWLFLRG